jgi:hypothetical protein
MPEGGSKTPINPNMIQRVVSGVAQGVRQTIAGIVPNTWFSPLQPLTPVPPPDSGVVGRLWNYEPGYNLNINPRPYEGGQQVFTLLRELAEVDIVRAVIETRKDQLDAMPWDIKIKEGKKGDYDKKIAEIKTFLQQPDGYHSFDQWLGKLMEDMLVIDAATIYRRRDRAGRLIALDVMDGATIAVKIDEFGRVPMPPSVAYQQILNGVVAADYATDEIFYLPRKLRNNTVYGFSPVEQIAFTINLILKRMYTQLASYDTSNIPPGLLEMPLNMDQKQIDNFMKALNARISGNIREQAKLFPVPSGTKYQEIKKPLLIEREVEEWLTRVVCFAFSISPQAFVKEMNRATAETSLDAALMEGLTPLMLWVKRVLDRVIAIEFQAPDLEFGWMDDKEQDPKIEMEVNTGYVKAGILAIDSVRAKLGENPLGDGFAVPQVLTASGYTAILSPEEQAEQREINAAMQEQAMQARAAAGGGGDEEEGEGEDGKTPPKPKKKPAEDDDEAAAKSAGYSGLAKGVRRKPGKLPFQSA